METVTDFIFLGSKITTDGDCSHKSKIHLLLGRKAVINLDSILKIRDINLTTKVCLVKAMVFPVVMYGYESGPQRKLSAEELMLLNCGAGEDSWESFGLQEIKPVHPEGNQYCIFIGRTDAETPILWPPDAKNWFIGKDLDAGKDWRQEEKGVTEDEMVGWHHQLNGHEFEQALRVHDGQGSLACCSPWAAKESDTIATEV